jgi:hypothetical protein
VTTEAVPDLALKGIQQARRCIPRPRLKRGRSAASSRGVDLDGCRE